MLFKKDENDYSESAILRERTFPKINTVLIVFIVMIQIALIAFAVLYENKPQDIIESYNVTATPNSDGTLDIEYSFVWTPLDSFGLFTWLDIGTANSEFTVYKESCSKNISQIEDISDGYFSGVRLYFNKAYEEGETFKFSYKIRQSNMLCSDDVEMFYEFVPGWFNSTPVKSYTFRWASDGVTSANTDLIENGYYIWKGEMKCGEYAQMDIYYPENHFKNAEETDYMPFNPQGAYDELNSDKPVIIIVCIVLVLAGVIAEVLIIDGYVSYNKGRGFIGGYGYPMHIYGRRNQRYIDARNAYNATRGSGSGGFHGGGCACACACACAGGGRAGCSQKDTFKNTEQKELKA